MFETQVPVSSNAEPSIRSRQTVSICTIFRAGYVTVCQINEEKKARPPVQRSVHLRFRPGRRYKSTCARARQKSRWTGPLTEIADQFTLASVHLKIELIVVFVINIFMSIHILQNINNASIRSLFYRRFIANGLQFAQNFVSAIRNSYLLNYL